MIIYGSKSSHLATSAITGACSSCATEGSLKLYAYQKYAHVFWIPFVPIGVVFASQCSHCKQILDTKEVKLKYPTAYTDLKNSIKTPVWTFTGLGIVAALIGYSIFLSAVSSRETAAFIKEPMAGDVYEVRTADKKYTLYKVTAVKGDSVEVAMANYAATMQSGLDRLKSKSDTIYGGMIMRTTKEGLQKKYQLGDIIAVTRKK